MISALVWAKECCERNSASLFLVKLVASGADPVVQFPKFLSNKRERIREQVAVRSNRDQCRAPRKFRTLIQLQSCFSKQLSRKIRIIASIHAPEPQTFFVHLQKTQTLFQFLYRARKRRRHEINIQIPVLPGEMSANPSALFPCLILFNAATILI